jgi:glycosyltransferase involved in cell wall biosynthesis
MRKIFAKLFMMFSLIISTRGRTHELLRLFQSLANQTLQDFEVILSDQNDDDRLLPVIQQSGLRENLMHLKSSGGLSKGRNQGIDKASGDILCFPDDDCAYPANLLQEVAEFFQAHFQYGYLSGRSFADDGGDSVSRHARQASPTGKMTIHAQCIEFALFIRRSQLGGLRFDENMGVGAPSPWHSDEGPDLLLRLGETGVRGYYDPHFGAWHPRPVTSYDAKAIDRTYRYACGNGYFYRKHHYPAWFFAYQMGRSLGGFLLALSTLNPGKARLYLARIRGRWRGWRGKVIGA